MYSTLPPGSGFQMKSYHGMTFHAKVGLEHSIGHGDLVRRVEGGMIRRQELDGGLFVGHAFVGDGDAERTELVCRKSARLVVLHYKVAAFLDKLEQCRHTGGKIVFDIERTHAN